MRKKQDKMYEVIAKWGVSVRKFADMCGISTAQMYLILKGHVPRYTTAVKIAKATKGQITIEDLGWEE